MLVKTLKQLRRLIIAIIGFTVLAIGVALIVLPGPAIIVIPAGLAILSVEFAWARNLQKKMKDKMKEKINWRSRSTSTDNESHNSGT